MKKNIILFSIFIFVLTIIPINIKAQNLGGVDVPSFESSSELQNLMKTYPNLTLSRHSSGNIRLLLSPEPHIAMSMYSLPFYYNVGGGFGDGVYNKVYVFEHNTSSNTWINKGYDYWGVDSRTIIWADHDIYYNDEIIYNDCTKPIITYDYNLEINPNNYNYVYLKFKGVGDLKTYIKHNLTNPQGLFYHLYKNKEEIYIPYIEDNSDTYFEQFFVNSLDNDVFTLILPLYKYKKLFQENDIYNLYFTVPGLIEYGTNEYQYNIIHNEDGTVTTDKVEHDREEIEDFLTPGDNEHTEITSTPTSTNSLTNSSLNEFMWPYSLFARNGTNIKNVSLVGKYNSTSSISPNDFNSSLNINYGSESYGISINNCIFKEQCYLTDYEQTLIKNILFDRNVENSEYYLQFLIKPLKNISLSDSDQFNFGISLEFNSSVELTINSMLLAINNLSNSYYNVYFKLYDSSNKVHTIYKTSLAGNYVGVNQFKLEERTSDIYRVDLMFVYNHTATSISVNDKYVLEFSEFNIFANTNLIHIYTDNTNITYQTCEWFNLFCHIQNGFTWLVYEAPILKDFWVICLKLINIFNIIWTLITYIFLPFDIIPPLLGVSMSSLMPVILIVLFIIKKIWFGGGD